MATAESDKTALDLLNSLMNMASRVNADDNAPEPGYSNYHIEIGPVGWTISAKKLPPQGLSGHSWVIRTWYTYNA